MDNATDIMTLPFASGGAEQVVREVRFRLRTAQECERQNDTAGARWARSKADALLSRFATAIRSRCIVQMRRALPQATAANQDDEADTLAAEVLTRIADTDNSKAGTARWETHFNQCFQSLAVDTARHHRAYNGYARVTRTNAATGELYQASVRQVMTFDEKNKEDASGGSVYEFAERLHNSTAERAMNALIARVSLAQLMGRLSAEQRTHLDLYIRHQDGETWTQIARPLGVDERTVRNWMNKLLAALARLAHGEAPIQ